MLDLDKLDKEDAQLVQIALRELGLYVGTTYGNPGPKTMTAYRAYRARSVSLQSFGDALAEVALKEVGTREEGNNGGARIRSYQGATWYAPGPWPWYAAFVCWCYRGAQTMVPNGLARPTTPGAWDFERWARDAGAQLIKPAKGLAKKGDIVVFTFSHIGIVSEDQTPGVATISTVEGNTNGEGSREGDGVYRKTRKVAKIRSLIRS